MWPDSVPTPILGMTFGTMPNTALQQAQQIQMQQAAQAAQLSAIGARIRELDSICNDKTYLMKDKCLTLK